MKKIILTLFLAAFFCSADAQYTKLFDFNNSVSGSGPQRGALLSAGAYLYGTTQFGGANDMGTIYKIKPDGTGYVKMFDFDGTASGKWPHGALVSDGTFLYGITSDGGNSDIGVIFKIKPDGTGFAKVLDFNGTNGGLAEGSLIYDGTYLYGMSLTFGPMSNGLFFKIKPDGTGYVDLYDCWTAGTNPYGDFIMVGSYLYGMTFAGGSGCGCGTIFKIKPDGTGFSTLMSFAGSTSGSYPVGSLYSDGTYLYGMTGMGGANDMGTIFKIKTDGTAYTKLLDFAGTANGSYPQGSLVSDGTYLYGTTARGGTLDSGTVFKIKTDGTGYARLLNCTGPANGANPLGTLWLGSGLLYGTTSIGGAYANGTIFRLGVVTGINEYKDQIGLTVYPNPFSDQTTIAFEKEQRNATIRIFDLLGKTVSAATFSGSEFIIEKGEMTKGIYFVQVTDEENHVTNRKIILE